MIARLMPHLIVAAFCLVLVYLVAMQIIAGVDRKLHQQKFPPVRNGKMFYDI